MAKHSTRTKRCIALLMVALCIAAHPVHAQVCEGDIILTTQAEVDAFNCSEVTRYLGISAFGGGITNLDGLSELTTVGGWVRIDHNPVLTNVDGLSSLTSVVGWLTIADNRDLTNVNGLSGLTSLGALAIDHNPALTNLDGLSGLTSLGSLEIYNNNALTNVDGLSGLTSVGGLLIYDNPALTNLDGLAALTSVASNLLISNNDVLSRCCGLYPLLNGDGVAGTITIRFNAVDVAGCRSEREILYLGPCTTSSTPTAQQSTWSGAKVIYRE